MKYWSVVTLILIAAAMVLTSCVRDANIATANSDKGHLFIDLDDPLAVGWESEIVVLGPATGEQHCDNEHGCYSDHLPVEVNEVTSSDPSVVEVVDFKSEDFGEVETIRITLNSLSEGEARIELSFDVDGYSPGENTGEAQQSLQDDQEDAEDNADEDVGEDEQEDTEENAEEDVGEDEQEDAEDNAEENVGGDSDWLSDSFEVETREVSSVRLSRLLEDVDPAGPFAQCPASDPGTYLVNHLDDFALQLKLEKIDDRGNLLRGTGKFPFDVEPEDAVDVEVVDEARHLVVLRPQTHGLVEMTPTENGVPFEAYFTAAGEVNDMTVALHALTDQGTRGGETSFMVVNYIFELEVGPYLPTDAPLCGGIMESSVQSLTPAICDVVGTVQDSGNPALLSEHGGECVLRITLEGAANGHGLVEDVRVPVHYDW